jgi:hypothetical protein
VVGNPRPEAISTSYVERQNLTMRTKMRRFTGLTNAFSKKLENLKAAVALRFALYNFCRIHESLKVTPAMQAGLVGSMWTIVDLVSWSESAVAQAAYDDWSETSIQAERLVGLRRAWQTSAKPSRRTSLSEDLVYKQAKPLGRFGYLSLGSTTLAQLKKSRYVKVKLTAEEERRKPDGIVFLPLGGIKAVIEVKTPAELTAKKLPAVVKDYSAIARAVCKLLIITDGKKTYWYNALTEAPVLDEDGNELKFHLEVTKIDDQKLAAEVVTKVVGLIEKADHCLTDANNKFHALRVNDPSGLAKTVWQKIWINTGKEPEKCLYNVVEILVFKFLSDIGVLTGNHSFRRIVELLVSDGDREALNHYGRVGVGVGDIRSLVRQRAHVRQRVAGPGAGLWRRPPPTPEPSPGSH